MKAMARAGAVLALLLLVTAGFSLLREVEAAEADPAPEGGFTSGAHPAPAARSMELPVLSERGGDTGAVWAAGTGDIRLHNMAVWDSPTGSPGVFVSFTPVTRDRIAGEVGFRTEVVDGEEIEVADVAPELDESDVAIEIDDVPADMSSMHWYYAGYGDLGGADMKYMPVCVIRVERPDLSPGEHALRVMIDDKDTNTHGEGIATFGCAIAEL